MSAAVGKSCCTAALLISSWIVAATAGECASNDVTCSGIEQPEKKGTVFFTQTVVPPLFTDRASEHAIKEDLSFDAALLEDDVETDIEVPKCNSASCKKIEGNARSHVGLKSATPDKLQGSVQHESMLTWLASHIFLDLALLVLAVTGFRTWLRYSAFEVSTPGQKENTEDQPAKESNRNNQALIPTSTSNTTLDFNAILKAMKAGNEVELSNMLDRSVNACDEVSCCTALHAAAHCNCLPAAKALLSRGADTNVKDVWDETPLHFASRAGHVEFCKLLLQSGAELNAINAQDWTPLLVAAEAGKGDVCSFLLDQGAHTGGADEEDVPSLLLQLLQCRVLAGDASTCMTNS